MRVVTEPSRLASADLVVVNGLLSAHTRMAVSAAVEAGTPVAFTELAYLGEEPVNGAPRWSSVGGVSDATRASVAANAGCPASTVVLTGTPQLDDVVPRRPSSRVLALTSVTAPTITGGHLERPGHRLFEALQRLEAAGYEIGVRPHPREDPRRWDRWPLVEGTLVEAIASSSTVVGVPGTATLICAGMGVPFVGIESSVAPRYLVELMDETSPDDVVETVRNACPPSAETVDRICGSIGGAADRIISLWKAGLGA